METSGVVSLAIRPNQPQANDQYGVGGLSGKELQRKFDNLARLAISRCNMLVELLSGEYQPTTNQTKESILDYILTIKKEDSELDNDMSLSDVLANILTTAGELKAKNPTVLYDRTDKLNDILKYIWDTVQFMDQNVDTLLSFAPFSMDVNYDEDGNVTYRFYNSRGNEAFKVSSDMLKGYRDFLAAYSDQKLANHNNDQDAHQAIQDKINTQADRITHFGEEVILIGNNVYGFEERATNLEDRATDLEGAVRGLADDVDNLKDLVNSSGGSSGGGTGNTGGNIDTTNFVSKDDIIKDLSSDDANNDKRVVAASAGHSLYKDITTLNTAVKTLQSDVDAVESTVTTLNSNVDALQSDVDAVESAVATLNSDVGAVKSWVAELEDKVETSSGNSGVSEEEIAPIINNAINDHNEAENSHEDIRKQFNHYLEQIYPTTEKAFNFFVGTREEYEELDDKTNLFAIITDDEVNNNILSNLTPLIKWRNSVMTGETVVARAESDFSGVPFMQKYLQQSQTKYLHQIRITYSLNQVNLDAYFNLVLSHRYELKSFNDVYSFFRYEYGLRCPILATGIARGNKLFNIYSVEAVLDGNGEQLNFIYTDGTSAELRYSVPSNLSINLRDLVLPLANVTWNSGGGSGGGSGGIPGGQ